MSNTNTSTNKEEPVTNKTKTEGDTSSIQKEEVERIVNTLEDRIERHDNNRKEVQDKLHNICEKWRKEIDDLEDKINSELDAKFKEEDSRLQAAMNNLQAAISADEAKITEALQRAKAELLVMQKYSLNEKETTVFTKRLKLTVSKEVVSEWFDSSKPRDTKVNKVSSTGRIFLSS